MKTHHCLAALLSCALAATAPLTAQDGGWVSLFDGTSLSGWTQKKVTIIRQTPIAAVNTNGGPNG